MSDPQKKNDEKQDVSGKTDYLQIPEDTQPMAQRPPSPGTTQLTSAWRVNFKFANQQQRQLDLTEDKIIVGRAMDDDPEVSFDLGPYGAYHYGVSRKHAMLTLLNGSLYIEDLGSTNGTRINGFQLTPRQKYRLRDGDEIEFARLRSNIRFMTPGG